MILGSTHFGGTRAETVIASVTVQNTVGTNVFITFQPDVTVTDDTVFLVYLNGRLQQRLPGNTRSAEVVTPDYSNHRIEVIAWPYNLDAPDFYFTGIGTRRAHLQWDKSTAPDVAAYVIQHSNDNTTYTNFARQETFAVLTPDVYFTSNAGAIVQGTPQDNQYKTATFTLTVIDDQVNTLSVTNNVNDETWNIPYVINQFIDVVDGVMIRLIDRPVLSDSVSFSIGLLPYYETPALSAGTHYFRIQAEDVVGNLSTVTTGIPVLITPPPDPVQSFEIDDNLNYVIKQSASSDVSKIHIYSNYDPTTDTLLPAVDFNNPFKIIPAEPNEVVSDELLTSSFPDGDYIFVARAVTTSGIDDNTAVPVTVSLPYIPAELPKILLLTAIPGAGGSVTLKILSDKISDDGWNVVIYDDTDTEVYQSLFVENATAELGAFSYNLLIPDGLLPEGILTAYVNNYPSGVTFTTDETAPDTPLNVTAISF